MVSNLFGQSRIDWNAGATSYAALTYDDSSSAPSTDETIVNVVASSAGTLGKFRMKITTAPGVGKSWVFTVRVNGADTGITVTISGSSATSAADTTHTASVSAGDLITVKGVPSGTPDASGFSRWNIQFTGSTANESLIPGGSLTAHGNNVTRYTQPMMYSNNQVHSAEANAQQVIPTGGTIKNLYIKLRTAPTVGGTRIFTLYKNGSSTALTCSISNLATTGNDTTHSVSVVAGDTISIQDIGDATSLATVVATGLTFVATTDGEGLILGGSSNGINANETDYNTLANASSFWFSDESYRLCLGQAMTLSKFYIKATTAPGSGDSFTFSTRVNSASPSNNISVVIADAATTGNDTTHTVTVANDDTFDLRSVATTFATTSSYRWGLVQTQPVVGPANVKTVEGLAIASTKTVMGLATASVKTVMGLA